MSFEYSVRARDRPCRSCELADQAHATTLECRRASIARTQSTTRPDCRSSRSINARAHWTSRWRIFLSTRLEIPSRFALPPVLYCFGASPIAAAKSRPLRYCFPSPSPDASRLAVPTPGIVSRRRPTGSSASCRSSSFLMSPICWVRFLKCACRRSRVETRRGGN